MGYYDGLQQDADNHTLEELEKLSTQHLLSILNALRKNIGYGNDYDNKQMSDYFDRVKIVLATREHVLNKPERKKIRQERAKQKK